MASRKEEKERLRRERLEREAQAAAATRRKRLVGYVVAGVLGVALVAGLVILIASGGGDGGGDSGAEGEFPSGAAPPVELTDLDEAAEAAKCEVQEAESEGDQHVTTSVTYEASPPHSGDHFPEPAEDGSYTDAPQIERLVHSLEHGRIYIQFSPDAPDSVKGDLKALFDEDPYHMIIAPNETNMEFEVAATAWTRTLGCKEMNDKVFDAIRAFREEFRDQGPEFVP